MSSEMGLDFFTAGGHRLSINSAGSHFYGALTLDSNLSVGGVTTFSGSTTLSGSATLTGPITLSGPTTLSNSLNVTGAASTFTYNGPNALKITGSAPSTGLAIANGAYEYDLQTMSTGNFQIVNKGGLVSLQISNNGNIGINANPSSYTLDVNGSGHFGTNVVVAGNLGVGISPNYKLDVSGTSNFSGNMTVNSNALYVDAANKRIGVGKTPTVALDVNGGANISGSVGVGTTTPTAKLQVAGTVAIGTNSNAAGRALCMMTSGNVIGYCISGVTGTGGCICIPIN